MRSGKVIGILIVLLVYNGFKIVDHYNRPQIEEKKRQAVVDKEREKHSPKIGSSPSSFTSLLSPSDAAAARLSKHEGPLDFNGLTSLSEADAESLSKHKGGLDLNGLTSLSNAAAESLSKHKGPYLNLGRIGHRGGVTSLSDAAAESLSKHEGGLSLISLTSLSDAAAESLLRHEGHLSVDLLSLPASAAEILRQHPSLQDE